MSIGLTTMSVLVCVVGRFCVSLTFRSLHPPERSTLIVIEHSPKVIGSCVVDRHGDWYRWDW